MQSPCSSRSIAMAVLMCVSVYAHAETPSVPPEPETYENPTGEVALPDALALALRQNPELKAFAWDLRAAEARGIQARLRPNPELSLEIEELRFERGPGATTTRVGLLSAPIETTLDIPTANGGFSVPIVRRGFTPEWERSGESGAESGLKEAEITLSFSQLIELGGKRARRVQVAQHDREISAWDYEIARADVLAETASAFFAVLAAQERLNLAGQLADLAQQVVDTVSARVEAGKVSPIELSKAEVEHGTIRIDVERARRELDAARSRLASAWGATDAAFARAIGAIESVRPVPTLDALRGRAERSPDIRRWMAEVERRAAEVELERANAWPDVTLTLGLRSTGVGDRTEYSSGFNGPGEFAVSRSRISTGDSREESIVLGASMPLPLFNRNQGRIREAEHLTSKASEERRAAQVQVLSQLAVAYHALDVAYVETQALETQILPKAIEAFEATREGYLEGKFGLLEVLEAERTLFDSQSRLLDSRTAYHQRVIEIERLTGQPLSAGADGDGATEEEP